ncbi:MAG: GxxExxY protein [Treponema sp.]|jgi:GxxExxY protein|nr:GxxExxY protein [Treponema sp.]
MQDKNLTTNHTNQHEQKENVEIIYKDECYKINRCIYAVNKKLGCGFLESVYQEALEIELKRNHIPFNSQQELEIIYDGTPLTKKFVADIVCFDKIILELKAVSKITEQHKAQLMNYMAATGFRLGILVNFNHYPKAEIIRMVR